MLYSDVFVRCTKQAHIHPQQRQQAVLCVLPEHTRTALRQRPVIGWRDWPRAPTAALGRTRLQLEWAHVASAA